MRHLSGLGYEIIRTFYQNGPFGNLGGLGLEMIHNDSKTKRFGFKRPLRSVVTLNGTPSQVLETGLGLGKSAPPVRKPHDEFRANMGLRIALSKPYVGLATSFSPFKPTFTRL